MPDIVRSRMTKWEKHWVGLAPMQFSSWTLWCNRGSLSGIDRVGVYVLAKHTIGDVPVHPDPIDGKVIYIGRTNVGRTTSLKKRLDCFDKEAFGNGCSHSGASSYRSLFEKVEDDLYVSICPVYWVDDRLNLLARGKENYNAWISNGLQSGEQHPFIVFLLVNWLEVLLRGLYVYKLGRLPLCNKE